MIISFKVFKDKILSGEKKQTIRRYNEKRFQQFTNVNKYQLYWGSPRNEGELLKEVDPLSPYLIRFDLAHGIINAENDAVYSLDEREKLAKADGFNNYHEMLDWFIQTYGTIIPFNEMFIVVRWK